MTCVFGIDDDTIGCFFVCVDVAPRRHEVEFLRAPTYQESGRQPRGGPQIRERRQCKDVEARLVEPKRVARRHWFDDPGVMPSHAPPVDSRAYFEDIRHRLEAMLQGVPNGMWSCIQDEGILE
jgi:hypothetical protein